MKFKKKVNLLGDKAVGKTSLTLRYVKDVFGEEYLKTIGTNVYKKVESVAGGEVNLQVVDILGDEGFENVRRSAFQGSSAAIAVADLTRKETLYNLEDWVKEYKSVAGRDTYVTLALNKKDLEDQIEIDDEDVSNISFLFNAIIRTSAKEAEKVDEAFTEAAQMAVYSEGSREVSVSRIVGDSSIPSTPKGLVDACVAYTLGSSIGPSELEGILESSGVDIYEIEDMGWEEAEEFSEKLIEHYKDEKREAESRIRGIENLLNDTP